jgi:LPXTG-motif cell wall-anchored protein
VACGELTALMNSGGTRPPQGLPDTGQSTLFWRVAAGLLGGLILIGCGLWQRRGMAH